jgi:ABC-type polysaccharide/polyol phosphate export permease
MADWDRFMLGLTIIVATAIMSYIVPDPPLHSIQFLFACVIISVCTGIGFIFVVMAAHSSSNEVAHG